MKQSLFLSVLMTLSLVLACSCKEKEPVSSQPAPAPVPAPAGPEKAALGDAAPAPQPAAVTVKVLDPGAEPREKLRYRFAAGKRSDLEMVMRMAMNMTMGDTATPQIKLPGISMSMSIDHKSIQENGALRYEFKLEGAKTLPTANVLPQVESSVTQEINKVVGMHGFAVVDPRGMVLDADVEMPAGAPAQISQMVEDVRQQVRQMCAPFPEEPVGLGARWEVTMPVRTTAISMSQVATYTLKQRDGDKLSMEVSITQNAPAQAMRAPNLPAEAEVNLSYLKSAGSGTMGIDLGQLVPTSKMSMKTSMAMTVKAGGQTQNVATDFDLEADIHPAGK
ncbi:MAG: hypothetical protein GYA21_08995 [Myxococcales bacterium]|nr:hypothetical protein [Myxococcales bacterium]